MAVRKLKNSWWVDFQFRHRRYRKRSPANSRTGAIAYEIVLRQALARDERIDRSVEPAQRDQTFREFSELWFEDYVKPNNKHSEQLSKKYALAASLVPFFGQIPVRDITGHDIERYKAQQLKDGYTNKTTMNRLTVLNKCLVTAYEWLRLSGAPPKIKWPRCTPPVTDYLSPDECEVLLRHADGVAYEMVLTALRTGMRQGEIRALQWSSIDWLTRNVAVRHSRDDYRGVLVPPKNNRPRHIPLDIDLYEMLHRRKAKTGYVFLAPDGQPFNNDRLHNVMGKLCRRAGLRRIGWHTLRHTFASHLAMRGVPLPAIKELLGHASITTTMRYAHVAPSTLRAAIEMLNPKTMFDADLGQPGVNHWQAAQRREVSRKMPTSKYA
jgi:integrase